MNLCHFEHVVSSVILERSSGYHGMEHVIDLVYEGKGRDRTVAQLPVVMKLQSNHLVRQYKIVAFSNEPSDTSSFIKTPSFDNFPNRWV